MVMEADSTGGREKVAAIGGDARATRESDIVGINTDGGHIRILFSIVERALQGGGSGSSPPPARAAERAGVGFADLAADPAGRCDQGVQVVAGCVTRALQHVD